MYIPTNSKSFPFSPHSLQHLLLIDYFDDGHSDQRWYLIVILNCISLIMSTLMAESEEELKSLFMKVKEESENVGLKISLQKTKIMDLVPSLHGK